MIHGLAGELGLDVYVISLSRSGMDDSALIKLLTDLPEKCIALMEDVDAAFRHGITRNLDNDRSSNSSDDGKAEADKKKAALPEGGGSRITLSGLLNALDGVAAHEGRLLFATTNCYDALDPALCRPGRMDLHVEFKLASKYQAEELFKCFYLPSEVEASKDEADADESSGEDQTSEDPDDDCSYSEQSNSPSDDNEKQALIPSVPKTTTTIADPSLSTTSSPSFTTPYAGADHRLRAPKLSHTQIMALATQFSDAIPERLCSMASLQGYLMMYKTRPEAAATDAKAWVEHEFSKKRKGNKVESDLNRT